MSLKESVQQLDHLLANVAKDLIKVTRGNKAAAQRVRVGTIKLERVAKEFRRESVAAEKSGKLKKPKARPKKKPR
jgi:Histone H1-like protein Hc1